MSSTYAHYQGPSSLPSDYASLSRLTTNHESGTPEPQPENTAQITRRESLPVSYYDRPLNPTIGVYPHNETSQHLTSLTPSATETSPLLDHSPVPCEENRDYNAPADNTSTVNMFWEELAVLTKSAIPVFGYAPSFIFFMKVNPFIRFYSTQLLEYSLVVVSVVSIGHISTTALAAISLGSMTAGVSGYSVILGLTSALDTVLPSAWTSNQPQLVGLWTQRMSQSFKSLWIVSCQLIPKSPTAVVVFVSLAVSTLA